MPIISFKNNGQTAWLYYYNGNFYYPVFLKKQLKKKVDWLINKFINSNKELVIIDRAHTDYKTKYELALEQGL